MSLDRRRLLASWGGFCAGHLLAPTIARAQNPLPDRDLEILIGFVGGGGTDIAARLIAAELERRLGRHVSVRNRPGESGTTMATSLKQVPPDGSAIAFIPSTTLAAKLATNCLSFDPVNDLAPISMAGTFSLGFAVSPRIGVSTFADYLQWARNGDAQRRRLGSTASDAFIAVLDRIVGRAVGLVLEPVAYRGAYPLAKDLEEGRLPAAVSAVTSLLEHHRGGRLKLLLTSSTHRLRKAPDIPTARELGFPALEMREWFAFFAPPAMPRMLVDEWNRQLRGALSNPDLAGELAQFGLDVDLSSPEELASRVTSYLAAWSARMREAGVQPVNPN